MLLLQVLRGHLGIELLDAAPGDHFGDQDLWLVLGAGSRRKYTAQAEAVPPKKANGQRGKKQATN